LQKKDDKIFALQTQVDELTDNMDQMEKKNIAAERKIKELMSSLSKSKMSTSVQGSNTTTAGIAGNSRSISPLLGTSKRINDRSISPTPGTDRKSIETAERMRILEEQNKSLHSQLLALREEMSHGHNHSSTIDMSSLEGDIGDNTKQSMNNVMIHEKCNQQINELRDQIKDLKDEKAEKSDQIEVLP
jgi:chromosome segregation ATPase